MKTKTIKPNKEEKEVKIFEDYNPRINNVYRSAKNLSLVIENALVAKAYLNKPRKTEAGTFTGQTTPSWTANAAILLNQDLKEKLFKTLKENFKNEKFLAAALEHFETKKITVDKDGREIFYANVIWKPVNGILKPRSPLDIAGLAQGQPIPFSFIADVKLGFTFSPQYTFPCYLNGFKIKQVLIEKSEGGVSFGDEYSQSVTIDETDEQETVEQEVKAYKEESQKEESLVDKLKLKFF